MTFLLGESPPYPLEPLLQLQLPSSSRCCPLS
jgi:hypothetical protein